MTDIDLSMIGQKTNETTFKYTWKDVVLYALGVGAQPDELQFVYERVSGGLKVVPSYATIVSGAGLGLRKLGNLDFYRWLHGEQMIRIHRPFDSSGEIAVTGEVLNIYDKGKAAVFHIKVTGKDAKNDEPMFESLYVFFYVGGGGFGGDRGPDTEKLNPPEGVAPDFSLSYKTNENQAALYRLNGDLNPLHLDPQFAKMAKQERPILHGLCTYGYATRAIVHGLCDGDVSRLQEFKARFSNVVYPGDTLTTEGWKDNGRYLIQVKTDRGISLSNAYAIVK